MTAVPAAICPALQYFPPYSFFVLFIYFLLFFSFEFLNFVKLIMEIEFDRQQSNNFLFSLKSTHKKVDPTFNFHFPFIKSEGGKFLYLILLQFGMLIYPI